MITDEMIDAACAAWADLYPKFEGEKEPPRSEDVVRAILAVAVPNFSTDSRVMGDLPNDKPHAPVENKPEWIWYCESTSGVPVVTFGRWPKHPQQARYKLAETQPTEHDHPKQPDDTEMLRSALRDAVNTIQDYLAYKHSGDPWEEDSRAMGEMDINEYGKDGRLEYALSLLVKD